MKKGRTEEALMEDLNRSEVEAEIARFVKAAHHSAKVVLETTARRPNAIDDAQRIVLCLTQALVLRELIDNEQI